MSERTPSINGGGGLRQYTGGQYGLARGFFGLCMVFYLLDLARLGATLYSNQGFLPDGRARAIGGLIPNVLMLNDGPGFVTGLGLLGAVLALLLCIGVYDRIAAGAIWYIIACLHMRNPLAGGEGVALLGWLLLAHILIKSWRYGTGTGRTWRMPPAVYAVTWCMLAVAYASAGVMKLTSGAWMSGQKLGMVAYSGQGHLDAVAELAANLPPWAFSTTAWVMMCVEIGFVAMVLVRPLRPIVWAWTLIVHQTVIGAAFLSEMNLGILMLHVFCFDPSWIAPRAADTTDTVFYDARCGLCRRFARFVLAEDWSGSAFRFAALDREATGESDRSVVSIHPGRSVIVQTAGDRTLVRSTAVLHVMHRLGGMWAVIADMLALVPRPVRDAGFSLLAWVGRRLYGPGADRSPLSFKR